jgi:hypothetical protein
MAQDKQYRELKLTDGRTIKAEVLETVATGLEMRVPQGKTLISFEILMDMVPIEAPEYRVQEPVRVYVHAPGNEEKFAAVYGAIEKLELAGESNLPPGVVIALEGCEADFDCMSDALSGQPWMWLVTATPPTDDREAALIVRGRTTGGQQIAIEETRTDTATDIWHAAHAVIGLIGEGDVPKSVLSALGEDKVDLQPEPAPDPEAGLGWTKARVYSSSFFPVPGYTAARQGDTGGLAVGLTVGLLGTGATAGILAATRAADSGPIDGLDGRIDGGEAAEIAVFSAATYYALSVVLNQATGMRAYNRAKGASVGLSVQPTRGGGASFGIGGRL